MLSKKALSSYFFSQGLKIRPNAMQMLQKYIQYMGFTMLSDLQTLTFQLSQFEWIDQQELATVLKQEPEANLQESCVAVLDIFNDVPRFSYSSTAQKLTKSPPYSLLNSPSLSQQVHRQRFKLTQQRVLKHPSFRQTFERSPLRLTSIDGLIGTVSQKIVLGTLVKVDGQFWYLQDLNSSVRLEIASQIQRTNGLFCQGMLVLIQGEYREGVFVVYCISQPVFTNISNEQDFFGADTYIENQTNPTWPLGSMIIVISNIHLNELKTLQLLDQIFQGFSGVQNLMFVLMGNFSSEPQANVYSYQKHFRELFQIISKYPNLKETGQWVLIPGPKDPGLGSFMPRHRLPDILVDSLKALPFFKSSTNPSRICYGGKKMLFGRVDQLRKLHRNKAIELESAVEKMQEHLAHTVVKQGHICPSLYTQILPGYDSALYTISADLVCLADNSPFHCSLVEDIAFAMPGHFSRYSSFLSIVPSTLQVDQCSV